MDRFGPTSHLDGATPSPRGAHGEDTTGRLRLELDEAGEVAAVTVPRLAEDDVLREAGPLTTALQEAWEQAQFVRLTRRPRSDEETARLQALGAEVLAGRLRVEPPPAPPRPSEVAPSLDDLVAAAKARRAAGVVSRREVVAAPTTEVVRDGGVRVEVSAGRRPERIVLDPDWAARASAATLSATLTRALSGADREVHR